MSEPIDTVYEVIEQQRREGYQRGELTVRVAPAFYKVLQAELDDMVRVKGEGEYEPDAPPIRIAGVTVKPTTDLTAIEAEVDHA